MRIGSGIHHHPSDDHHSQRGQRSRQERDTGWARQVPGCQEQELAAPAVIDPALTSAGQGKTVFVNDPLREGLLRAA